MAIRKGNTIEIPDTWVRGLMYGDGKDYPTISPPRAERKPAVYPPVERDVTYGPFVIRCMYVARDGQGPKKLGYMLVHPDSGSEWRGRLYRTVPDARAIGAAVAQTFHGLFVGLGESAAIAQTEAA